jgi:hypothetical protein
MRDDCYDFSFSSRNIADAEVRINRNTKDIQVLFATENITNSILKNQEIEIKHLEVSDLL